jgi:hypothetical protein
MADHVQAGKTFICDGCGEEFPEKDGTGIRGFVVPFLFR